MARHRREPEHRHVSQQFARDAAEDPFAQARVTVAVADHEVGAERGGAFEQLFADVGTLEFPA